MLIAYNAMITTVTLLTQHTYAVFTVMIITIDRHCTIDFIIVKTTLYGYSSSV